MGEQIRWMAGWRRCGCLNGCKKVSLGYWGQGGDRETEKTLRVGARLGFFSSSGSSAPSYTTTVGMGRHTPDQVDL